MIVRIIEYRLFRFQLNTQYIFTLLFQLNLLNIKFHNPEFHSL